MQQQPQLNQGQQYFAGGPQQNVPQNQQVIIVCSNSMGKGIQLQTYNVTRAKKCGYIQMAMGISAIIWNMGAAIINYNTLWTISAGWWGSAFIITAGCCAVASARYRTSALIRCTLAFSILSLVMLVPLWVQIGLSLTNGYQWGGNRNWTAYLAMNSLLLITTIVEFVAAMYQCIICCVASCNCCKDIATIEAQRVTGQTNQQVHYVYYNNAMASQQPPMQVTQFTPQQQVMAQQQQVMAQQQFLQQQFVNLGEGPVGAQGADLPPSYDNIGNEKDMAVKSAI